MHKLILNEIKGISLDEDPSYLRNFGFTHSPLIKFSILEKGLKLYNGVKGVKW